MERKNKIGISVVNYFGEYYNTYGNCIVHGKHINLNHKNRYINYNRYGIMLWKVKIS